MYMSEIAFFGRFSMSNNLFISYDLYQPGQNYQDVAEAIKQLGNWAKVHQSYWYVNSNLSASEACARIWRVMDQNDSLIVVDTSHDQAAWNNLKPDVAEFIKRHWHAYA